MIKYINVHILRKLMDTRKFNLGDVVFLKSDLAVNTFTPYVICGVACIPCCDKQPCFSTDSLSDNNDKERQIFNTNESYDVIVMYTLSDLQIKDNSIRCRSSSIKNESDLAECCYIKEYELLSLEEAKTTVDSKFTTIFQKTHFGDV